MELLKQFTMSIVDITLNNHIKITTLLSILIFFVISFSDKCQADPNESLEIIKEGLSLYQVVEKPSAELLDFTRVGSFTLL